MKEHIAILLTGTNEGELDQNLEFAIDELKKIGEIISLSSVFGSEAWGFSSQDFRNQGIQIKTKLSPFELLQSTQQIELKAGRKPKTKTGYEARVLDIDIIFYDNEIIDIDPLTIPHPHMQDRKFVLQPLNEIIPEFVHPILNKDIQSILELCNDKSKVWKIE